MIGFMGAVALVCAAWCGYHVHREHLPQFGTAAADAGPSRTNPGPATPRRVAGPGLPEVA